jgi:hypothetical protein
MFVKTEPYRSVSSTEITTGSTGVVALAANRFRKYALFIVDGAAPAYLWLGNSSEAAANKGIRINANGGSYEMSMGLGNLWAGVVAAASTAVNTLLVLEGYTT